MVLHSQRIILLSMFYKAYLNVYYFYYSPFLFAADKYLIWFITMYNEQVSVLCCSFYLFFILYEFYKALSTGSDEECIGLNSLFSPELMDEYPQISQFNTHTG